MWQVDQCYLWAICSLSQESGKLANVICGRFVHYPGSLESWSLLCVGELFIIPGVGKLGAICSLSQEFGKLVTVMCGRFVHYPREFGKLTSVICGRFVYYPRSLVS